MTSPSSSAAESADTDFRRDDRRIAIQVAPRPHPEHPLGQKLVEIWTRARDAGHPLARADIPSRPLLRLMPHIFLLEPNADGSDWRFRLFGTAIASRFGGDATNRLISETYDEAQAHDQAEIYRNVALGGAPHITQGRVEGIDRQYLKIEFCHLPIEPPAPGLRWLLGGVFVFELP